MNRVRCGRCGNWSTRLAGLALVCYDPDCTVRVTVDGTNAVAESNEGNNVAMRTDLG